MLPVTGIPGRRTVSLGRVKTCLAAAQAGGLPSDDSKTRIPAVPGDVRRISQKRQADSPGPGDG